ncbi:hypothetical protein JHK87_003702 [Glycine soja]|nr:hypothetical protein JHK87_003702 [Glycine soja]
MYGIAAFILVVPSLLHSGRALPPSLRPCPHFVLHSPTDKVSPMCHVLVVCHHHQRVVVVEIGCIERALWYKGIELPIGCTTTTCGIRDSSNDENSFPTSGDPYNQVSFKGDAGKSFERRGYGGPRGPYRGGGGHRGGFSNGEIGEAEEGQPQRAFDRCNGIGRGNEFKREGSGRGNWGTQTDELAQVTDKVANETEKNLGDEKPTIEEDIVDGGTNFVRTLDPKAVNDENCTGNTSDGGNNTWLGEEQDESEEEAKRATVLFPNKK